MEEFLLPLTIALPLIGVVLVWVATPLGDRVVRWTTLVVSLATLALAGWLIWRFPTEAIDPEAGFAGSSIEWLGGNLSISFAVALDGLSVWMFGLSALLMVTSVLVSWTAITDRAPLFYSILLLLEFGCLGVFAARDIMLFYVFFEFTLIPLFLLIGVWGSEQRRYAAIKFFLFTLAGSLLTFLGLLAIVLHDYQTNGLNLVRFSIPLLTGALQQNPLDATTQLWIFLALFVGFAIKVPLFPLHTWLPLAHVQAPTAGSVFLAGVLLKIGAYGFLRFSFPMLPDATAACMPWLLWLSVAGIIYGALVALAQSDIKRLIAYSSVSHLGYCMLGLFALNRLGVQGGALQMINHGISTGGLFAIVGMIYERYHTREIVQLRGLARQTPWLAFFMLVFTLSSIGLPGLNGFTGEVLVLLGAFQRGWGGQLGEVTGQLRWISVLAVVGVVLGAWYMLNLVRRVFFGADIEKKHSDVPDMSWREVFALAPLAVFVVWIGVQPKPFLDRMSPTLNQVLAPAQELVKQKYGAIEPTAKLETAQDEETLAGVR